ncbi:MAG: hypothetical protein N2323_06705, partial [candidate division WOR-3 bacterium]|nr:hypothetical protein [candidate division WOR-3 bacterium]
GNRPKVMVSSNVQYLGWIFLRLPTLNTRINNTLFLVKVKVKKILKCPEDVKIIALTPLGYPNEDPPTRSRKPLSEIVCYNQYQ